MSARPSMFELQLGHLCNDRCVFCISGRLTSRGEAPLLAREVLAERLRLARAAGHEALTFLGGEPTIQPFFLDLVRLAVELGFAPIVIFTNGGKAGRGDLVERVLETGGTFEWRFSFQGATEAAHDATTRRRGSFQQLLRAVERVAAREQRIAVNTCVVAQNFRSLGAFPELLAPFDVAQLHVDMIHPEDTGNLSLEELRPIMVRYVDVAPFLREMVHGLPAGFDVNVGNVPQCLAPDLAPWIHHGGRPTLTSQVHDFGLPVLQPAQDKYAFKERKKLKPASCRGCVFDGRCSGLFPEYAELFGASELTPIVAEDDGRRTLERALERIGAGGAARHPDGDALTVDLDALEVAVGPSTALEAHARYDRGSLRVLRCGAPPAAALLRLRALDEALRAEGWRAICPLGDDALQPPSPRVQSALLRFRRAAPFGSLEWATLTLEDDGRRARLTLKGAGARVEAWVDAVGTGYRLVEGAASPAVRGGLRALFDALRAPA